MQNYAILVDSASDLGKDIRKEYDIDYVNMMITVGDKEYPASLDWDCYSPKQLYDWMSKDHLRVFTSQVPDIEFRTKFKKYLDQGRDIIYISCSSGLTASLAAGRKIAAELMEEYPNRKIIGVDSLCSCLGQGSMAIDVAKMRANDKTIEEAAKYIEENRFRYNQFATVGSLTYLKKAGRVSASSAFFGNIIGVKPVLISDINGMNYAYKKVKGRMQSIQELADSIKSVIENPSDQIIYISHACCDEDVKKLQDIITKEIHPKGFYVNYMGPIIGASCGPDTIGIYCFGKECLIDGSKQGK